MKNNNSARKLSIKSFAVGIGCLILLLAIIAQILFNIFVAKELQRHSAFTMRTLIVDAIQGLDDLRKSPEDGRRIPEARVMLPPESESVTNLRYTYTEPIDEMPASVEITTRQLASSVMSLNGLTIEEIFDRVPEAQACSRGYSTFFGDTRVGEYSADTLSFITKKQLADGREVQIWREKNCGKKEDSNSNSAYNFEQMDALEEHLLQIQSY